MVEGVEGAGAVDLELELLVGVRVEDRDRDRVRRFGLEQGHFDSVGAPVGELPRLSGC